MLFLTSPPAKSVLCIHFYKGNNVLSPLFFQESYFCRRVGQSLHLNLSFTVSIAIYFGIIFYCYDQEIRCIEKISTIGSTIIMQTENSQIDSSLKLNPLLVDLKGVRPIKVSPVSGTVAQCYRSNGYFFSSRSNITYNSCFLPTFISNYQRSPALSPHLSSYIFLLLVAQTNVLSQFLTVYFSIIYNY